MTVHRLDETVSTNIDARAGKPGDVYIAEFQSAGRGRLDHVWHAAKGENLTFSAVLSTDGRDVSEVVTLPLVIGLAVARAVKSLAVVPQAEIAVKWPNDVLAGGRKLAGTLCERHGENIIAGIGLNVNQTSFPPEISVRATSLALLAGRPLDREAVFTAVLEEIGTCHRRWSREGFAALHGELSVYDALKGRKVSVFQTDSDTEPVTGICDGILVDGTLSVGGKAVYAGEAHVADVGCF